MTPRVGQSLFAAWASSRRPYDLVSRQAELSADGRVRDHHEYHRQH